MKRVDCCPYCTLAFCSVISISTQGLITPLHYTMSGAPGSRLRHAPFDWLRLGFSAQPHPRGLPGKQEEGQPLEPETELIIPDQISTPPPAVLYPSGALILFTDKTDKSPMMKSLIFAQCMNRLFCQILTNFGYKFCI